MSSGCGLSEILEYNVSAAYGGVPALQGVEGRISRGEIVGLIGLSGSGKSTLALALLGLLHYRGGEVTGSVRLEGEEIAGAGERRLRAIRGRRIGYVPQSPASALNPRLRVRTLLDETWRAHAQTKPPADFYTGLLDSAQLPSDRGFLRRRAGSLSAGQGQRLLIALAIMHDPAVVIADEPTSSLDAITQAAILRLFGDLNRTRGTAMLYISHDLLSVAALAQRVDILDRGRVVESGAPSEIFRNPRDPFTKRLVDAVPASPGTLARE
jgi:ABC-type glutathione transport system ATPase component